jgi:hypothetical protein
LLFQVIQELFGIDGLNGSDVNLCQFLERQRTKDRFVSHDALPTAGVAGAHNLDTADVWISTRKALELGI